MMCIRRATPRDVPRLERIRWDSIHRLAAPVIGRSAAESWAHGADPDRVARAVDEHMVWVLLRDNLAAGWVELDGNRVCALYVAPERAGEGVGSALLERAERHVAEAGFDCIVLEASANAETFYLSRGYVPVPLAQRTDVWPMQKTLNRTP